MSINENQHLERAVQCNKCKWIGINGQLIARGMLRCPKCDSAEIGYFMADAPERMQ
jgi:hypothetical protein